MAKISPLIFLCLLLLLQGALSATLACPDDEEPVEDSGDDSCEPEDEVTPPVTPPLNIPPPQHDDNGNPWPPPKSSTPPDLPETPASPTDPFTVTPEQILQIAPNSESCEKADPEFADECRTADVAAQHISASFKKYDINSRAEQAAILGWMAMESGEFRYSRNHFPPPGNVGQGTYNIQALTFNLQYITNTPELQANMSSVDMSSRSCTPTYCTMLAGAARASLELILQNDQYAFATGAWFMKEKCDDDIKASFADDVDAGWENFVKNCVYTPISDLRREYWNKAKAALGVGSEATEPAPAPAQTGSVLRRRDTSTELEPLTVFREDFDKFKEAVDQAKGDSEGLNKRTGGTSGKPLRPRDFSGFMDVMFGNRLDTICTEPRSNPSVEKQRPEMSASTLSLIHTIAACSGGESMDRVTCDGLPSSFSKQPSPSSPDEGNATLSYHSAYLSTLWLNLYALRPTKMMAPHTERIFNFTDQSKDVASSTKAPTLTPSALTQCTYLSSLQELSPSSAFKNVTVRSEGSNNFTRRRRWTTLLRRSTTADTAPPITTTEVFKNPSTHRHPLKHHGVVPRAEQGGLNDDRLAVVIRWVDDTCAAGVQEELYSEDDMARWCDEVGKAVKVSGGAVRALETFQQWLEVI